MTPYRHEAPPRGRAVRACVRYLPGLGLWPLVLAIVVGVPAAVWARREAHAPSVLSCTTGPLFDREPTCMAHDARSGGAPVQVACRDLPAALEKLLGPPSPLSRPLLHATEAAPPPAPPRSGGGCVSDDPPRPTAPAAPPSTSSIDGARDVSADTARELVRGYAESPIGRAPGGTRSSSVTVLQRDYTLSALVFLASLGLALASMLRRRATVTIDAMTLAIVERGFVRTRRAVRVPIAEIELVTVAIGASGPFVGRRVELVCRNGERIALVDAFTSLTARVHERTRARISTLLAPSPENTQVRTPATERPRARRSGLVALVALGAVCTLTAAATTGAAALRAIRAAAKAPRTAEAAVLARAGTVREGSTVVLASFRGRPLALVADEDATAVRAVDLPRLSTRSSEPLDDLFTARFASPPGAMVLDARGRLFVTLPLESAIAVLEATGGSTPALRETGRITSATEPIGLAITPDEQTLVAISNFGHALQTFRLSDLSAGLRVDLARSPRALTLSADGSRAIVVHATESTATEVDLGTGALTSTSLDTTVKHAPSPHVRLDHGRKVRFMASDEVRSPLRQARIVRVGGRFFVPGVVVSTGDTTRPSADGYYSPVNPVEAFTVLELDAPEGPAVAIPDRLFPRGGPSAGALPLGCILPRAVVADEANDWVYLACTGPGRVFRVDVAPTKRCYGSASWSAAVDVSNGPTGMAIDERERALYVWSQFAETLTVLPLDMGPDLDMGWDDARTALHRKAPTGSGHRLRPVARDEHATLVARGRTLFYATNDARISVGGPACASCHIDGREDALTWPTKEGPRQTPMLAGRLVGTAPYGWSGEKPDLSSYLAQTFRRLGGKGLPPDDEHALIAYIQAIPTPRVVPRDRESATRGRAIFESAATGCSGCHATEVFADGGHHDVRSRTRADSLAAFDTPSLLFVGGTAPYFHDGRYATLADLLAGTEGTMGHTSHLSNGERRELLAYLDSLGRSD